MACSHALFLLLRTEFSYRHHARTQTHQTTDDQNNILTYAHEFIMYNNFEAEMKWTDLVVGFYIYVEF